MIILMCYPLFSLYFHKNKGIIPSVMIIFLYGLCAFLCGSRTVWIGVGVYNLINLAFVVLRGKINLKSVIVFIIFCAVFILAFWRINEFLAPLIGNRLEKSLNWETFLVGAGRTKRAIKSFTWLFNNRNVIDIVFGSFGTNNPVSDYEMTYFAIFLYPTCAEYYNITSN